MKKGSRRRGRGEGAVFYSDAKGAWVARAIVGVRPNGRPKYAEVTARSKGEVLAKMRNAEQAAKAGRLPDTANVTVGQYLQHWLENTAKPSVEPTTWASYERCVRLHLTPNVGGVKLASLRPMHVEQLFAQLRLNGMSGGNAKKVSEVFSSALEHAVRVQAITVSPAAAIPKPKAEGEPIDPFTADEVRLVRTASSGHRLEAIFALAIGTGAREGELLGLAWQHVNFETGTVHFQHSLAAVNGGFLIKKPKSKRGNRVVGVPRFALDALNDHRRRMLIEGRDVKAGPIFVTGTGNYISKSSFVRQVHARLLGRAGVRYRKFHTFRHTHVSELLARGESVVDVAQRVGDRPDVVLRTYAHFLPGGGKQIADRLDAMYG